MNALTPCFLLVSNDPPRLDAYDEALKDRIATLPFLHALNAQGPIALTGGKRLESVRKDPASPLVGQFTRWAIEGLARVYSTQEVTMAPVIKQATNQFWKDTDPLTEFWETVSVDEMRKGIAKSLLRRRYESWCESENLRPFGRFAWARACQSMGLVEERRGKDNVRFWVLDTQQLPPIPPTSGPTKQVVQTAVAQTAPTATEGAGSTAPSVANASTEIQALTVEAAVQSESVNLYGEPLSDSLAFHGYCSVCGNLKPRIDNSHLSVEEVIGGPLTGVLPGVSNLLNGCRFCYAQKLAQDEANENSDETIYSNEVADESAKIDGQPEGV